jgi:serine/threonine protein kinase
LASKKGSDIKFAAKRYDRDQIESMDYFDKLKKEIKILQHYNHQNIIKLKDIIKTKKHYYLFFDFCNGGNLLENLENYQLKYGVPFPQEIVQILLKQIVAGLKIIHDEKNNHGNLDLESILINFNTEKDKEQINMMNSTVKISNLKSLISKINIIKKAVLVQDNDYSIGDKRNDILNLGVICYQMIFGKQNYDSGEFELIINLIEKGKYNYPIILSKEIISFMKEILIERKILNISDLSNHIFLTKDIKDFELIKKKESAQNKQEIKNLCIYCLDNPSEMIISPCGHKCTCYDCYKFLKAKEEFKKCPICKMPIDSSIEKVHEV